MARGKPVPTGSQPVAAADSQAYGTVLMFKLTPCWWQVVVAAAAIQALAVVLVGALSG